MESKQIWELVCPKCKDRYEVYLTKTSLDSFLADKEQSRSSCCSSPLERVWALGGIKMNFNGATRKGMK
jgi:hypothetical protein